jgi:signal transduction histidine kinase
VLDGFISTNRELIIARTRERVSRRSIPEPTEAELVNGVPLFLTQLSERLQSAGTSETPQLEASASLRGAELWRTGLTVGQVVQDYGNICQAITEVAVETGAQISSDDFRTLNHCLDAAVAQAVTEYARQREQLIVGEGTKRLGFLVHELRNLLNTATLAFDAVRSGSVGVGGSTGALVAKSLELMSDLVTRSLGEIRVESVPLRPERVQLAVLIEGLTIAVMMHAKTRGVGLSIFPVATHIMVDVDSQVVSAIVINLVQNACKFTHKHGRVTVRTRTTSDRVFVEIADECGGLPPGKAEELFLPYAQRGDDRTGVGLGLAISQKGARANGGDIHVQNVPGTGCVFTLELRKSLIV